MVEFTAGPKNTTRQGKIWLEESGVFVVSVEINHVFELWRIFNNTGTYIQVTTKLRDLMESDEPVYQRRRHTIATELMLMTQFTRSFPSKRSSYKFNISTWRIANLLPVLTDGMYIFYDYNNVVFPLKPMVQACIFNIPERNTYSMIAFVINNEYIIVYDKYTSECFKPAIIPSELLKPDAIYWAPTYILGNELCLIKCRPRMFNCINITVFKNGTIDLPLHNVHPNYFENHSAEHGIAAHRIKMKLENFKSTNALNSAVDLDYAVPGMRFASRMIGPGTRYEEDTQITVFSVSTDCVIMMADVSYSWKRSHDYITTEEIEFRKIRVCHNYYNWYRVSCVPVPADLWKELIPPHKPVLILPVDHLAVPKILAWSPIISPNVILMALKSYNHFNILKLVVLILTKKLLIPLEIVHYTIQFLIGAIETWF